MMKEENIFTAVPPLVFDQKRRRAIIKRVIVGIVAFFMLIWAIIDRDFFYIVFASLILLLDTFGLSEDFKKQPATIKINTNHIASNQSEGSAFIRWQEVTMAKYDGRYLDLFWRSSLREPFDLNPFAEEDKEKILSLCRKFLSERGIQIMEDQALKI